MYINSVCLNCIHTKIFHEVHTLYSIFNFLWKDLLYLIQFYGLEVVWIEVAYPKWFNIYTICWYI